MRLQQWLCVAVPTPAPSSTSREDYVTTLGMFFSFDGIDGVGKTTQMQLFCEWLAEQGQEVVTCRDPGSTALGERVREILLNSDESTPISPRCEMLLYMAARAQLVDEVNPASNREREGRRLGSLSVGQRCLPRLCRRARSARRSRCRTGCHCRVNAGLHFPARHVPDGGTGSYGR